MGKRNIGQAFYSAQAIEDELQRAEAIAELSSQLPAELLMSALSSSREMTDDWAQGTALSALAPRLAELGYPVEALQTISLIRRGYSRARALQRTMAYLPHSAYNEAAVLADAILQPENRSAAWVGIIPCLEGDRQVEAIQTAQAAVDAIAPGPIQVEAQTELDALVTQLGYLWEDALEDDPAEPLETVALETDAETLAEMPVPEPLSQPVSVVEIPPVETTPLHLRYNEAAMATFSWLNQKLIGFGFDTNQFLTHPKTEQYLTWVAGKHLGGLQLMWLLPLLLSMVCVTGLFFSGLFIGGVIVAASPQSVETLAVASDGDSIISRTSLTDGEMYTIAVSGRFNYNTTQPESWADAQSTYFQQTDRWVPAYWVSIDGQKVVAQQADSSQHLYLFYVEGRNRPIKFRIEERRTTEYTDNDGALVVDIYPGVVSLDTIQ